MKRILYISSIFAFAIALSSCCKEELVPPAETPVVKGLNVESIQASDDISVDPNIIYIDQTPLQINDDGDDEDENINTNKGKK